MADPVRVSAALRWGLLVSLALNLALVAMLGSWWMTWGPHGAHPRARMEHAGGPLTRALAPEDRRAIAQGMRDASPGRGQARAAQLQTLVALIRADPFDRAAVAAQLSTQRAALTARLDQGQSLLLDRLDRMDAAARAAYADRLEAEAQRRRGKRD